MVLYIWKGLLSLAQTRCYGIGGGRLEMTTNMLYMLTVFQKRLVVLQRAL